MKRETIKREVAIIWRIEDVYEIRNDLNDDQAMAILERCVDKHDRNDGVTVDTIRAVADYMFPLQ